MSTLVIVLDVLILLLVSIVSGVIVQTKGWKKWLQLIAEAVLVTFLTIIIVVSQIDLIKSIIQNP